MGVVNNGVVRCDGCGIISSERWGMYCHPTSGWGNISSQGRECTHDFCDECEKDHDAQDRACRRCGAFPDGHVPVTTSGGVK